MIRHIFQTVNKATLLITNEPNDSLKLLFTGKPPEDKFIRDNIIDFDFKDETLDAKKVLAVYINGNKHMIYPYIVNPNTNPDEITYLLSSDWTKSLTAIINHLAIPKDQKLYFYQI